MADEWDELPKQVPAAEAVKRKGVDPAKTARKLLKILQELPEEELDRVVQLAGCDCVGEWDGSVTKLAEDMWDPAGLLLGR